MVWVGIGGITKENIAEVILAGADGGAMISSIFDAQNISEACRQLRQEARRGLDIRREREGHIARVRR